MKITKKTGGMIEALTAGQAERKATDEPQGVFQSRLQKVASDNYEAKIARLLGEINTQAEKMTKKVDIAELKAYKRLVSDFLDEAVNNSHKFMKENKLDRRGRHRVYAIIKRVNEGLEDLTQEVLKEEKDNLAILQRLDDIRGLLLDITT